MPVTYLNQSSEGSADAIEGRPMKIAVGIATAGRRDQLSLTLQQLSGQTVAPAKVLVCPAAPEDFDESSLPAIGAPIFAVTGSRGLCAQRNAILSKVSDCDILLFLDDDYYPAPDYIEQLAGVFKSNPEVVIATSHPEHDGAAGKGLTHEFALSALRMRANLDPLSAAQLEDTYGGYGCNFGIRLSVARANHINFDENLPLYGWLEDIDFSRRLAPHGRVVVCKNLYGVHLGTKRGKSSGVKLGYSQVANPTYMMRKGSMTAKYGIKHILRNVIKNILYLPWPEPWVDRRGRAKGNLLAVVDVIVGKDDPRRVLEL